MRQILITAMLILLTTACSGHRPKPNIPTPSKPVDTKSIPKPAPPLPPIENGSTNEKPSTDPSTVSLEYGLLKPARWEALDGFLQDDLSASWNAWLTSCSTLKNKPQWQNVCQSAINMTKPTNAEIVDYFTRYFDVYSTSNQNGTNTGLITGYYEPILNGSRTPSPKFAYPLYRQPKDLITVELSEIYPELKYKRVRGKLVGNKLLPYLTREQIESIPSPLAGNEIAWVDDALDAFYLQIQGSGKVVLANGESVHLGYADQNGHAYNSIGKTLVQRGELSTSQASMQGIKDWARANPDKLRALMNTNPSYIFFKELPAGLFGPLGALGVPLTAERSVAIDPKFVPLGAPIFLVTTYPNSTKPLKRLMIAQDTGGAIKDGVRADFYWGSGNQAGKMAGAMKQAGLIWVLLPKEFVLPN